ncbi:unnamed protein product [Brachionus calyciflorus]|uniref:R3H domain-containing protein n=1 Tax=Brachionus calyciflorus TaxID=104777 RepID=A0A813UVK1_9BILA|nr:unnamed protein product [Brachionus calyciflorus]
MKLNEICEITDNFKIIDWLQTKKLMPNKFMYVTDAVLTAISEQYGFENKDDLVESLENLNTDFSEEDELFEVSDDQEILQSFNPNLALYEHEILSHFDKDYANHCDFENEMEVLIKNVYESKDKDFIEIRNLDSTKRHLIHTLADFYGLRHKTFERDTEQCFMIVSKLSYVQKSDTDRAKTSSSLIKLSTDDLISYPNVDGIRDRN